MKFLEILEFDRLVKHQGIRYDRANMPWISVPLKNGVGFMEVLSYEDGEALYGAFVLLARAAANTENRGKFIRNGRPMTLPEIARLSLVPQTRLDRYIQRLERAGWVRFSEITSDITSEPTSERASVTPSELFTSEPKSEMKSERRDLTRRDETGPDEHVAPAAPRTRKGKKPAGEKAEAPKATKIGARRFTPPTVDEVEAYASSLDAEDFDGVRFCAYYKQRGWIPGGARTQMKSWKAAVVTWLRR